MKLKIEIKMDNAAFDPYAGTEVARILRKLADKIDGDPVNGVGLGYGLTANLLDSNGKPCGKAKVTP